MPRRISRKLGGWRFYRRKRVKRFGKRTSFMKVWNERSSEFEQASIRQISRRSKEAPGAKIGRLILAFKPANRRLVSTIVSRDFDVIQPVSGPLPDCFLSTLQNFLHLAVTRLSHSKTCSSGGNVTKLRRAVKAQSTRFSVLCSAN
jgi:hypothetical protein